MGLHINTNVMALNAQRMVGANNLALSKTLERLSSGLRINRAGDDAAGLAVSEKLRSQINGIGQASRNAQDGISMIQTAEGALNETHALMQRMRELAVQAGTATLQNADRSNIQQEVNALSAEIDRIAAITDFNGAKLLNGTLGGVTTGSLGASLASGNGISAVSATTASAGTGFTLTVENGSDGSHKKITVAAPGGYNAQSIDVATVATGTKSVDFSQVGITVQINSSLTNISSANTFNVVAGAGSADILIGAGFNGVDATNEKLTISIGNQNAATLFGTTIDVSSQGAAQSALATIDTAIASVSTTRAKLGALQNRLEHTITNLGVAVENLSASNSRIRDTDVAAETSRMVSLQILGQAGTAMLSQANSTPQGALALLRG
ncbi:MAG: flagellin [Dehalococcoidia bacterium]